MKIPLAPTTSDPVQERRQRAHELSRALEAARVLGERLELLGDRPADVARIHRLRDSLVGDLAGLGGGR